MRCVGATPHAVLACGAPVRSTQRQRHVLRNQVGPFRRHLRHRDGFDGGRNAEKGFQVTGSDQNVYPPMSTFLAERQVGVMAGYAEQNLVHKPDLVVVGNALSRGNPEVEAVLDRKLRYCSLPELLKEYFIRGKRSLVVTGTHGKTTTASLLTWVFEHNGLNPSFLIGGIPTNLARGARSPDSEWFII